MDGILTCVLGDPKDVPHPLGVVEYATSTAAPAVRNYPAKAPSVSVAATQEATDAFTEIWTTNRPVIAGEADGVAYGHDGQYAFCAGHIPAAPSYAEGVRVAYLEAFEVLERLGYRYVVRMWNLIGGINQPNANGLEIYRDFSIGRAQAFEQTTLPNPPVPAGTGVGAHEEGVTFYLVARRTSGHTAIENPHQISAFRYPERYGPRPPMFARATCVPETGEFFLSGTASIIGHETVHEHDLAAQCRATVTNITHVTSRENLARYGIATSGVSLQAVKVYVRHRSDLDYVRQQCSLGKENVFVVTDLCRIDLLVEIEATARHDHTRR